jgi:hypothetical protein
LLGRFLQTDYLLVIRTKAVDVIGSGIGTVLKILMTIIGGNTHGTTRHRAARRSGNETDSTTSHEIFQTTSTLMQMVRLAISLVYL